MTTQQPTASKTGGRMKPIKSREAEKFWWKYMRWSGILLVPLVFGHLAIVHLINSVAVINYEWVVTQRWSVLPWRFYDGFMLWFAAFHGFRGLKYVIDDYVHGEALNRTLTVLMIILMLALLALGTIALVGTPFSVE